MRETTSALTRVALLVVMTGLFAAVWSNDQQTQSAFIIARLEAGRTATQLAQAEPTPLTSQPTLAVPVSSEAPMAPVATEHVAVVTQVTVEMTLPPDITPGRFRVVQPSGAMFTIRVSSSGPIAAISRDVYVVEVAEGERSCFIRIDQPDDVAHSVRTTASREESTPH